jgi:hypothetical protein
MLRFLRNMVSRNYSDDASRTAGLRNARIRLSIALCRGNSYVFCRCAGFLAKVTGRDWRGSAQDDMRNSVA